MIFEISSQDINLAVHVGTQLSVCDNLVQASKLRQIICDFI